MADYSLDVASHVDVANTGDKAFKTASGLEVSNKDGQPFKSDSTLRVPDPIKTESTFSIPDPIKTESTLSIPDPIKTESTAEIDLKPVALDQCLRIRLDPVPTTHLHQPYRQHIGFSLFGIEIFGIDLHGEMNAFIEGSDRKPHVVPTRAHTEDHRGPGVRIRLDR
ncbi:MAG: hypothetical protein R2834_19850 [Rhodothermales bacterium]